MIRPTLAHVDLDAIASNFGAVTRYVAQDQPSRTDRAPDVIAVVKANAYGHGLVPVARTLAQAGAAMLACADIREGMTIRESGVTAPILIFGALAVSDLNGLFSHDLTATISSPSAARALERAALANGRPLHAHLKIDTGMNRLGFRHDNLGQTLPAVASSRHLVIDGLYTHFATADDPDDPFIEEQCRRFDRAWDLVRRCGIEPRVRHAANSAALLHDSRTCYDAVRPGLLLYGIHPPNLGVPRLPLRAAMTLRSRVTAVKGVRLGERAGYGGGFAARRPTTLAIVPAGYADGVDARLGGRGHVLIHGRRLPIVGSVCMDMMEIDVTGLSVEPNDEVVIIGTQGDARIDVSDVAAAIGSVPYEVVCRIGGRIERVYNDA